MSRVGTYCMSLMSRVAGCHTLSPLRDMQGTEGPFASAFAGAVCGSPDVYSSAIPSDTCFRLWPIMWDGHLPPSSKQLGCTSKM